MNTVGEIVIGLAPVTLILSEIAHQKLHSTALVYLFALKYNISHVQHKIFSFIAMKFNNREIRMYNLQFWMVSKC